MKKQFVIVNSVTYAMRGKDILRRHGIRAYIERVSGKQDQIGCGYGLYIPERIDEGIKLLKNAGISIRGFQERGSR